VTIGFSRWALLYEVVGKRCLSYATHPMMRCVSVAMKMQGKQWCVMMTKIKEIVCGFDD